MQTETRSYEDYRREKVAEYAKCGLAVPGENVLRARYDAGVSFAKTVTPQMIQSAADTYLRGFRRWRRVCRWQTALLMLNLPLLALLIYCIGWWALPLELMLINAAFVLLRVAACRPVKFENRGC